MSKTSATKKVVLASHNRHKIQEIQAILGTEWQVLGAHDVAPGVAWQETGDAFVENARIKIKALRSHVNGWILADDSGLCVEALGGKPGVHSSSFGGVEGDHARNVRALLTALKDIPEDGRQAYFYCLLLLSDESGNELQFEGRCYGRIAQVPAGAGGFGYDPIFVPKNWSITMAEMSEAEKNAISHRGQAMAALKESLSNIVSS